jgi:enoyl-CoA hydratase
MGVSTASPEKGICVVTVDFPPVNALPVQGWYDLADAVRTAGRDPEIRCVVLTAEGRGFNAGVDIKELQQDVGHRALVGANRGCYEAFAAVYECEVPVVAAVNGFCLGGGIGLVATRTRSSPPTTPPSGCRSWTAALSARPPTSPGSSPSI